MKEAGEYAGAHVLSMVRTHYPLMELARLKKGYPKDVGPKEADNLRIGLLDLSSTVIGDINFCRPSTPLSQPSLDGPAGMWREASLAGDARLTPAILSSQAPMAQTSSTMLGKHMVESNEQPQQRPPA